MLSRVGHLSLLTNPPPRIAGADVARTPPTSACRALAQRLGQFRLGVGRGAGMTPGDKLIGSHENAAGFVDLASVRPVAGIILVVAAGANDMRDDVDVRLGRDFARRLGPGFAADAGEEREAPLAGEIERRTSRLSWSNTQTCGRCAPGRVDGLIIELVVALPFRLRRAVGDDGARSVALVHLDAVAIELVGLERDRLAQRFALLGRRRVVVAQLGHVGLHLHPDPWSTAGRAPRRSARIRRSTGWRG